ncbi:MAG: hydrogenase maturation protease [Chthonomonadaceae bacterium]|nr:hydrogenase maturation protease [Chthonomonadaceae bacterium]
MSKPSPRILVAGIGNLFLGDDGFGVATAHRLARRRLPHGVTVTDFGIRGLDLAYALLEAFDAVIFIDVAARGGTPGTLYVIEPSVTTANTATLDAHGMDPVKVLAMAQAMGAPPIRTIIVACEPEFLPPPDSEDVVMKLSAPVAAAVDAAASLVEEWIVRLITSTPCMTEVQNHV